MRRFFVLWSGVFLLAFLALPAPLSLLVLDLQSWQQGRVAGGWQVKVNRGTPRIDVVREGGSTVLHLKSESSSFALERGVDVDPAQMPYLTWRWKVSQLPRGGDFRHARTDDQAAQVLVAFADHRVLTYIWDSSAPQGIMQSASAIPMVHIYAVVCRSGAGETNRWVNESRNLAQDYEKAYGRPAPRVKGIRLQINSQHTGSSAESYFGEVSFRSTPQ